MSYAIGFVCGLVAFPLIVLALSCLHAMRHRL